MKNAYLGILLVFIIPACSDDTNGGTSSSTGSSSSSSSGEIMDAGMDADYQCGVGPGTMGNSKGVGKYCDTSADCAGQTASICATLGDPTAHFCTKVCDGTMPSDTQCGENAACSCNGGPCGCTPASCGSPDDGGTPDGG